MSGTQCCVKQNDESCLIIFKIKSKMTRERDFRKVTFFHKEFEDVANLHVNKQLYHGIPNVMFDKVDSDRGGGNSRGVE